MPVSSTTRLATNREGTRKFRTSEVAPAHQKCSAFYYYYNYLTESAIFMISLHLVFFFPKDVVHFVSTLYTKFFPAAICSELSNPAFGTATLSGRTISSTATYTCNSGYNLVGTTTRTCEELNSATADWSGTAPICERMYMHGPSVVTIS